MQSMTGYGTAGARLPGSVGFPGMLVVECASLNRKQLEVAVQLPREWNMLEPWVREEVQRCFQRGRIAVTITLQAVRGPEAAAGGRVDRRAARLALEDLRGVARELGLSGEISLELVLKHQLLSNPAPGLVPAEGVRPTLKRVLREALLKLRAMREEEGKHLAADLRKQHRLLARALGKIRRGAERVVGNYEAGLRARLARWNLPEGMPGERLAAEVAMLAERCDITEETTRLESHLEKFLAKLDDGEPVGRTLEFLVQEMFREVNTIGSKANDAEISGLVVECKSLLDKLREQLANLE